MDLTALKNLIADCGPLPYAIAALVIGVTLLFLSFALRSSKSEGKEPESFPDLPIPGFLNAYRYILQNQKFLEKAKSLSNGGRTVLKFWMGPERFYLVTGSKNVQAVLRNSGHLSSEELVLRVLPQLDGVTAKDLAVYQKDKTGRGKVSLDKNFPEEDRIWHQTHKFMVERLSGAATTDSMVGIFCDRLTKVFEKRPQGEWETIQLWHHFIQKELVEVAITSLAGKKVLEMNPGFLDAMWGFDGMVYPLVFFVPKWFYPSAYRARDRFHDMGAKWLNYAFENYDFEKEEGDGPDWEETFGTRFVRTHAKFLRDKGFDLRSRAGMALGTLWAQNANSGPVIAWCMMEVIRDPVLFQALRKEVSVAFTVDPSTGSKKLDHRVLNSLPLLQSIYAEAMRLHVSVNLTRSVDEDMVLDGFAVKKKSLVQCPSSLGHLNAEYWDKPGHPADQFWAERFLVDEEVKGEDGAVRTERKFSMAGHAGHWYPYGGGPGICAGRHFAKLEIEATIALLVMNFDVELLEYVHEDGSKSDRGPKDHPWWCGTAAMPPDRDMKIRWKRV